MIHARTLREFAKSFGKSSSGSSAVEFAIFLPVLLLLFLGSFSVFDATRADRQIAMAAVAVSDMSTRLQEMDESKEEAIFQAAQALLGKYVDQSGFYVSITSITNELDDDDDDIYEMDETDDYVVDWSTANHDSKRIQEDELKYFDLPAIPDGASVIIVVIGTNFEPFVKSFAPDGFDFEQIAIRRPRFVERIAYPEWKPETSSP